MWFRIKLMDFRRVSYIYGGRLKVRHCLILELRLSVSVQLFLVVKTANIDLQLFDELARR